MMSATGITETHLQRLACLYVRQSTLQQVFTHTESTARQYALRDRALALGWPPEQIVIIDQDLGQSGASAADRVGFQRLVADVGLGKVGLVLGLEVSRLARSSSDWHHLLEICALTGTLILDEDGLYNPALFNDRLLLGLKRPASYCTSCSTSRHMAMIGGGWVPTVELRHPSTPCSPSPPMASADIAHMLARECAPKGRPPATRL